MQAHRPAFPPGCGHPRIRNHKDECGGRHASLLSPSPIERVVNTDMKILISGGTLFLGRHLVEAALAGGHQVTLFNRAKPIQTYFLESRICAATATRT